ncbi:hypothetical protein CRUP_026300 [Coryphaenoides rupestris]|nr:hypothetical protein CRUP_026300 [Coryphaenoides rupestris]
MRRSWNCAVIANLLAHLLFHCSLYHVNHVWRFLEDCCGRTQLDLWLNLSFSHTFRYTLALSISHYNLSGAGHRAVVVDVMDLLYLSRALWSSNGLFSH